VLVVFLFISWLSAGNNSASAWELFSVADVVLTILGLAAVAIAGSRALDVELPVQWLRPHLLKWIGAIALTITLTLLIEFSNGRIGELFSIEIGGYVSILACLAMLAGAILAERPDLADKVADAAGIDAQRPAAAPPGGLGPSTTTAAPATPAASPTTSVQPATGAGAVSATPSTPPAPGGQGGGAAAPPPQPAQSTGPPPGWYPDPQGQARLRYWDGTAWTEQTSA
jgi:hypothetical protein